MRSSSNGRTGWSTRGVVGLVLLAFVALVGATAASATRMALLPPRGTARCSQQTTSLPRPDDGRPSDQDVFVVVSVESVSIESASAKVTVAAMVNESGVEKVAATTGRTPDDVRSSGFELEFGGGVTLTLSDVKGSSQLVGINQVDAALSRVGEFPFDAVRLHLTPAARLSPVDPNRLTTTLPLSMSMLATCTNEDARGMNLWMRVDRSARAGSTLEVTATRPLFHHAYVLVIVGLPLLFALVLVLRMASRQVAGTFDDLGVVASLIAVPSLRSVCVPSYIEAPCFVDLTLALGAVGAVAGWCWQRLGKPAAETAPPVQRDLPPPVHHRVPAVPPAPPSSGSVALGSGALLMHDPATGRPVIVYRDDGAG